jgi:hypothetical protein
MATVLVVVLVVDGDDDAPTRTCTRARNALLADSRIDGSDSRIGGGGGGGGGARPKGKPKARATGIGTQLLPCTPISDSAAATRMYNIIGGAYTPRPLFLHALVVFIFIFPNPFLLMQTLLE